MINQLRQVIQRYSANEINYGEFRRQFVRFMASSDQDPVIERLYNFIEGVCSGFEQGFINESGLKLKFREMAPASVMVRQNAATSLVSEVVVFVTNAVGMQPAPAGNNAARISSPAANTLSVQQELQPLTY